MWSNSSYTNLFLGRRVRKMKERMGMTDWRKKANRMNFGELGEDVMQDHLGFDTGQVWRFANISNCVPVLPRFGQIFCEKKCDDTNLADYNVWFVTVFESQSRK